MVPSPTPATSSPHGSRQHQIWSDDRRARSGHGAPAPSQARGGQRDRNTQPSPPGTFHAKPADRSAAGDHARHGRGEQPAFLALPSTQARGEQSFVTCRHRRRYASPRSRHTAAEQPRRRALRTAPRSPRLQRPAPPPPSERERDPRRRQRRPPATPSGGGEEEGKGEGRTGLWRLGFRPAARGSGQDEDVFRRQSTISS